MTKIKDGRYKLKYLIGRVIFLWKEALINKRESEFLSEFHMWIANMEFKYFRNRE